MAWDLTTHQNVETTGSLGLTSPNKMEGPPLSTASRVYNPCPWLMYPTIAHHPSRLGLPNVTTEHFQVAESKTAEV